MREIAGWALIVLSLFVFYNCFTLLTDLHPSILEGGALTLIGVVIFRGGIHLLKIAVAARICLDAADRMDKSLGDGRSRSSTPPAGARQRAV
jgi:hypothetical protein